MPNRVIHFEVQADNVGRAKVFYEKTFGWEIKSMMSKADGGMMDYWGIKTGPDNLPGINGGLYERNKDKIYTYDCTILVQDIDKSMEAVRKNGGRITHEKSELKGVGWFATALDTEGNKFDLMQATDWKPS